jgi:pectinesterase
MRPRTLLIAVGAGALVLASATAATATPGPHVTVADDGSGDFTSIQAAVDAVPVDNPSTFTIKIKSGVYEGQVIVPANKPFIVFRGEGDDPADVVISDNRANGTPKPGGGTWGTTGSASVTIDGHDFAARNLTFENSFDEAAHPEITNRQAVALLTRADRVTFENVRFIGNQDTLYLNSSNADTIARVYLRHCYVEGDVDFIFGRATAVLDRCTIHSLDRGSTTNNGYVTAASTSIANPHGFLFSKCTFTGTAADGTVFLGRPWHPSNDPNAIAQVVIRDSKLAEHINPLTPWTDFGVFSWRDARYAEFHNKGFGAVASPDRPQLSEADAALFTPEIYLAGTDGWDPIKVTDPIK